MDDIERVNVIVNTTRITVPPENRKELCQTISSLLGPIRSEAGCITCRLYEDASEENSFVLIGEWQTRADWDNHFQSDHFAVLLGSILILCIRSNLDFKLLSHVAGIETVTKARTWCHRGRDHRQDGNLRLD
jgi:quinol monooxygenase YgiN